ncbi:putative cytochrome c oxidase subunit 6b-like [Andrographis paniculata]|uniref:putative cytochrome c oxidase subunit 6b-like n=1 Tax=Andrographis paniculata TaxID=175694 RepID=UPI0021E7A670|nr:putative cytochrome c oxidase subunit 6b-like [Andrographis paniculata]
MSASIVEPHDKMRARDVNKVARGEQAPRPPQQSPPVSRPPPPSSSAATADHSSDKEEINFDHSTQSKKDNSSNQKQRCYDSYYEYHKCIQEKGNEAQECKKVAEYYKSMCPDWIGSWRIE